MKAITLTLNLSDELQLKSIEWLENDTELPETIDTLRGIAVCILKSIKANEDSLKVQDLLNELGIERSGEGE
jgi:hypothetical protein